MGLSKSQTEFLLGVLAAIHSDVSGCYHISEKERARDRLTIMSRARNEGFGFVTKALPAFGKAIDKALSKGTKLETLSFAKKKGSAIPSFLGKLLQFVFDIEGNVRSDADPLAVKHVRQLCYSLYKLELAFNPDSIESVLSDFVSVDAGLTSDFTGDDILLNEARDLITRITGSINPVDIVPRHGPGSVATGERPSEKMHFKRFYPSLDEYYPYEEYFYLNAGHYWDCRNELDELQVAEPTAKVVLVPKDSRGPRLISCEPLEIQWIQQGLSRVLVDHIESHAITRGQVNFTSQKINQDLALAGSIKEDSWVTLDMKEASDRVSLKLVKRLFGNSPILPYLLATRSTSTRLPSGEEVKLNKFAPMGSALCFPVESLCFFALAVCAIARRRRKKYAFRKISNISVAKLVYVYGDDIVVPHEDYECVIQALEGYHLMMNQNKCCTAGFFRESCGVDAFKGVIVTPTKFRRVPIWSKCSHSYLSWIEYSNSLWDNNYTTAAEYIRDTISRKFDVWTTPIKLGCYSFVRQYASLPFNSRGRKIRYNRKLQRREIRGTVATSHKEVSQSSGWCELLRLLPQMPRIDDTPPCGRGTKVPGLLVRRDGSLETTSLSEGTRVGIYSLPRRVKLKRGWFPIEQ